MDLELSGAGMKNESRAPMIDLTFAHDWQAEILPARPLILPQRHFTYPAVAEEVERGALEVLVRPAVGAEFLATCALGFRDPVVPTGLWPCPDPDQLCAVSGGYAYIISTRNPAHFTMIPFRPALEVRAVADVNLLLFVGHHAILAWGVSGSAWQTGKLSDEGVTITAIDKKALHGCGWDLMADKETPFLLDLQTGQVCDEHFD